MVLWGSIVNVAAIAAGSLLGLLLPRMNERLQRTVVQGMAIALCVLGASMAMKTTHYVWMVLSLVAGGAVGEWLQIERRFEQLGAWLERRVPSRAGASPICCPPSSSWGRPRRCCGCSAGSRRRNGKG